MACKLDTIVLSDCLLGGASLSTTLPIHLMFSCTHFDPSLYRSSGTTYRPVASGTFDMIYQILRSMAQSCCCFLLVLKVLQRNSHMTAELLESQSTCCDLTAVALYSKNSAPYRAAIQHRLAGRVSCDTFPSCSGHTQAPLPVLVSRSRGGPGPYLHIANLAQGLAQVRPPTDFGCCKIDCCRWLA